MCPLLPFMQVPDDMPQCTGRATPCLERWAGPHRAVQAGEPAVRVGVVVHAAELAGRPADDLCVRGR